jgi:hypothetical protein
LKEREEEVGDNLTAEKNAIFDPALLDLEVAIAKNVIYFPRL